MPSVFMRRSATNQYRWLLRAALHSAHPFHARDQSKSIPNTIKSELPIKNPSILVYGITPVY